MRQSFLLTNFYARSIVYNALETLLYKKLKWAWHSGRGILGAALILDSFANVRIFPGSAPGVVKRGSRPLEKCRQFNESGCIIPTICNSTTVEMAKPVVEVTTIKAIRNN